MVPLRLELVVWVTSAAKIVEASAQAVRNPRFESLMLLERDKKS